MKHSLISNEIPVAERGFLAMFRDWLTDRDHRTKVVWRAAVHESGHLLSCALFNRDIGTVEAKINKYWLWVSGDVVIEKVSLPTFCRQDLESIRHLTLAGVCAERLVLGNDVGKHGFDMSLWRQAAAQYLTQFGHPGIAWSHSPVLTEERKANDEALHQLQMIDARRVGYFLEGNRALLESVARELSSARRLHADRCHEILDCVERDASVPSTEGEANVLRY